MFIKRGDDPKSKVTHIIKTSELTEEQKENVEKSTKEEKSDKKGN